MKTTESVWLFGVMGALFLFLRLFRRHRRRSGAIAQAAEVRARLPAWVRPTESLAFLALLIAGLISVLLLASLSFPQLLRMTGASAVLMIMGLMLPVLLLALIGVNLISWLTPPLRKANLMAMEGSGLSFRSANRDLAYGFIVAVVVGALLVCLSVIAPWR